MATGATRSNGMNSFTCAHKANCLPSTHLRVNKDGEFVYIKYHFLKDGGQKQFTWDQAVRMSGEDPDYSKRDLWSAIERGEKITWTACVQIMKPEEADPTKLGFDPFDVTKVWPKKQFPVRNPLPIPSTTNIQLC